MFYFTGEVDLSFTLSYGGEQILQDPYNVVVSVYEGSTLVSTGRPILLLDTYHYILTVSDEEWEDAEYYRSYRFLVETIYEGNLILANGAFLVHRETYDNLDPTEVYLSGENSEVYMAPAVPASAAECALAPPAKPRIIAVEVFKTSNTGCDCV